MIEEIKKGVLGLDKDTGVPSEHYFGVVSVVRQYMGADASDILAEHMEHDIEVEGGCYYFPNPGDALKTWKNMLRAYRIEKGLDKTENLVGL